MQRERTIGEQKILFDREATIDLYRNTLTAADGDWCGCASCKNFALQRTKIYPVPFLQFLEELGIDPFREWEAFDYDFDSGNQNKHLYGGWFLFVGELVVGVENPPKHATGTFTHWFTDSFPAPALPTDMRICAVEFCVEVQWVLTEAGERSPNDMSTQHRANLGSG